MRYFVSYAAHRHGGGGFFGNVIVNSRMMDRWTVAALADAQRIAPGHVLRVVILSYHPLGTMRDRRYRLLAGRENRKRIQAAFRNE